MCMFICLGVVGLVESLAAIGISYVIMGWAGVVGTGAYIMFYPIQVSKDLLKV